LKTQTLKDFEWIVIDDGSTDDTEKLFEIFLSLNNDFEIRYYKVDNGGKHRAINKALEYAKGELFFIVDSDDYLKNDALEIINKVEKSIPLEDKHNFAGVCGLKGYNESTAIGTTFDDRYLDITMLERTSYGITGDKSEVFYTNLLRKYPFPEFENENFITECVVWDKIAYDNFKLRFFNEIIYMCNYLEDGLTVNSQKVFHSSPRGYALYLYQSGLFGKFSKFEKWTKYLSYYYEYRGELSFFTMAKYLNINFIILYLRLLGMKIFYKLYS